MGRYYNTMRFVVLMSIILSSVRGLQRDIDHELPPCVGGDVFDGHWVTLHEFSLKSFSSLRWVPNHCRLLVYNESTMRKCGEEKGPFLFFGDSVMHGIAVGMSVIQTGRADLDAINSTSYNFKFYNSDTYDSYFLDAQHDFLRASLLYKRTILNLLPNIRLRVNELVSSTVILNTYMHDVRNLCLDKNISGCGCCKDAFSVCPGKGSCRYEVNRAHTSACGECFISDVEYIQHLKGLEVYLSDEKKVKNFYWRSMTKVQGDPLFPQNNDQIAYLNAEAKSIFGTDHYNDVFLMTIHLLPSWYRDNVHPSLAIFYWIAQAELNMLCSSAS